MGLFQKIGRMIGIGKTKKHFPKAKISKKSELKGAVSRNSVKVVNNRIPVISWATRSLKLAPQYR